MDIDQRGIVVTGGSGMLGTALREYLPEAYYPDSDTCNIEDAGSIDRVMKSPKTRLVIHCAALATPSRVSESPMAAVGVNIVGTAELVSSLWYFHDDARFVYISTDYVFDGTRGDYSEADPVHPTTLYGWTKLAGEAAVRAYQNSLIIRGSFGKVPFPHKAAPVDQYTSKLPVTAFAARVAALALSQLRGVVHVGCDRRSVYDYARAVSPDADIQRMTLADMPVGTPADVSLNTTRYTEWRSLADTSLWPNTLLGQL